MPQTAVPAATSIPDDLQTFPNRHPERDYFVSFTCREFTTCPCPLTGRPDFATLHIAYLPDQHIIKNASLAKYLATFKNHGDYHEDCINIILKDLVAWIAPKYIEIRGQFTPRSSIATPTPTTDARAPATKRSPTSASTPTPPYPSEHRKEHP